MIYVDGFLSAVPTLNKEVYRRHSETVATVFRDHGAPSVVECWGHDVPDGALTSMRLAVRCEDHETVCLSWVTWPDKATRDAALVGVFADLRLRSDRNAAPYDGKRIIRGGFEVLASL